MVDWISGRDFRNAGYGASGPAGSVWWAWDALAARRVLQIVDDTAPRAYARALEYIYGVDPFLRAPFSPLAFHDYGGQGLSFWIRQRWNPNVSDHAGRYGEALESAIRRLWDGVVADLRTLALASEGTDENFGRSPESGQYQGVKAALNAYIWFLESHSVKALGEPGGGLDVGVMLDRAGLGPLERRVLDRLILDVLPAALPPNELFQPIQAPGVVQEQIGVTPVMAPEVAPVTAPEAAPATAPEMAPVTAPVAEPAGVPWLLVLAGLAMVYLIFSAE